MCASVAEVLKDIWQEPCQPDFQHHRPLHRHRELCGEPAAPDARPRFARVYREQLFANEIMLLPYYIASLNIEHAYYEMTGTYEPFEGLCFVDTLDLARQTDRLHLSVRR